MRKPFFCNEMRINFIWIIFLISPYVLVFSQPVHDREKHLDKRDTNLGNVHQLNNAQSIPKPDDTLDHDEKIISVRITSSVAVGRSKAKSSHKISDFTPEHTEDEFRYSNPITTETLASTTSFDIFSSTVPTTILEDDEITTDLPLSLVGANMEFIKQLQAKKGTRGLGNYERLHSFHSENENANFNQTNDSIAESSVHTDLKDEDQDVPLARSVPLSYSSKNIIRDPSVPHGKLTTVNFNIVHDSPKLANYNDHNHASYINPSQTVENIQTFYNQPSKVYSQPAQVYSEPSKFYSEPAKIYSEPAKIYSEPAKIYSEPAKIYSEPAKFYSQPASLNLPPESSPDQTPWHQQRPSTTYSSTVITTLSPSMTLSPYQHNTEHQPEKNYEVDEKISVMTDGQSHGEQPSNPENCKQENCKVGYVVEGRQFRKYRVEERTPDGFIVGEYGVVRNEDGALRGVRYTADSDASPRLIHDALMKFLQLK